MISWRAFGASRDCADKDAQIKKLQDTIYEMAEQNIKMEKKMLKREIYLMRAYRTIRYQFG